MRILIRFALLLLILLGCCSLASMPAQAQDSLPVQLGADYSYVRSNGPPGGCGCFSMEGGNAWASLGLFHRFSGVAEIGSQTSGNVAGTGGDLTITSYLFGPRYTFWRVRRIVPFGQVLVGGAHAGGSFLQTGAQNAFAASAGGGLDVNLSHRFSLRAFEADYYLTRFNNGLNDHQNNLRISAGILFHFREQD
jgi:outer membrane immunogenic protein